MNNLIDLSWTISFFEGFMFSFHIRFGVVFFWFQIDPHTPHKWDHTFEGNKSSNETVDIWELKNNDQLYIPLRIPFHTQFLWYHHRFR